MGIDNCLSVPSLSPRSSFRSSPRLCALWAVDWEELRHATLTVRVRLTETGAAQILTPAPDNLLAKRLAEKESMTSISVGNGLDTPAGMRYNSPPSSTLSVAWSDFFCEEHGGHSQSESSWVCCVLLLSSS